MTKFQPACNGPPAQHLHVFHSYLGCQGQLEQMKELELQPGSHFPPSSLFLLIPTTMVDLLSLPFALPSLPPLSLDPLCLPHFSPLTFTPSSVFIPPPSPSLPPGPCLTHFPIPASWAIPGEYCGPAPCWTPSEVAERWAPAPFPLLSGVFSGDLEEGREAGRGRQSWRLGSK